MELFELEQTGVRVKWSTVDQWARSGTVLSDAERVRADRFHFEQDRRRWVAARSALRHMLGDYTGDDPAALVFDVSEFGKPSIHGRSDVHFSLTHSHELIGLAMSRTGPVGLDCERIQPKIDVVSLSDEICSTAECDLIRSQGSHAAVFFQVWTRKEAVLKASGLGLSYAPKNLTVLPLDDGVPVCIEIRGHGTWRVCSIEAPAGYAAACCLGSQASRCWHGEDSSRLR